MRKAFLLLLVIAVTAKAEWQNGDVGPSIYHAIAVTVGDYLKQHYPGYTFDAGSDIKDFGGPCTFVGHGHRGHRTYTITVTLVEDANTSNGYRVAKITIQ